MVLLVKFIYDLEVGDQRFFFPFFWSLCGGCLAKLYVLFCFTLVLISFGVADGCIPQQRQTEPPRWSVGLPLSTLPSFRHEWPAISNLNPWRYSGIRSWVLLYGSRRGNHLRSQMSVLLAPFWDLKQNLHQMWVISVALNISFTWRTHTTSSRQHSSWSTILDSFGSSWNFALSKDYRSRRNVYVWIHIIHLVGNAIRLVGSGRLKRFEKVEVVFTRAVVKDFQHLYQRYIPPAQLNYFGLLFHDDSVPHIFQILKQPRT